MIITRPIQKRAPTLCRMIVEGTSNSKVAKEEDARTKAEHLRRQAHILVHGQSRESYVDPVEKCYEIEQHQERNQPPGDLANRTFLQGADRIVYNVAHPVPLALDSNSEQPLDCIREPATALTSKV